MNLYFQVDEDDFDLLVYNWVLSFKINRYIYRYVGLSDAEQEHLLHRCIAKRMFGSIVRKIVHHVDGNRLNNSRDNLMLVSSAKEHGRLHSILYFLRFKKLISEKDCAAYLLVNDCSSYSQIEMRLGLAVRRIRYRLGRGLSIIV